MEWGLVKDKGDEIYATYVPFSAKNMQTYDNFLETGQDFEMENIVYPVMDQTPISSRSTTTQN